MINIQLDKNTPEPVFSATAKYILTLRDILHGDDNQPTLPMVNATETTMKREVPVTKAVEQVTAPVEAPKQEAAPLPPLPETPKPKADDTEKNVQPTDGVELDVRGLPWDSRIHATTKTKMKNGEWKKLRGVEDVLVRQVETELRENYPEQGEETNDEDVIPDVLPATEWPKQEAEPEVVPEAPEHTAPVTGKSFTQLCTIITEKVNADVTNGAKIQEIVMSHGFGSVPETSNEEPEVIGKVYVDIEAL